MSFIHICFESHFKLVGMTKIQFLVASSFLGKQKSITIQIFDKRFELIKLLLKKIDSGKVKA